MRTLLIVLAFTITASAQVELQLPYSATAPRFRFKTLNFRAPGGETRVDLYVEIPYATLHFVKTAGSFTAVYELNALITGKRGEGFLEGTWRDTVVCNGFDETRSNNIISSTRRRFVVNPGSYDFSLTLSEPETEGSTVQSAPLEVRDFSGESTQCSDIMILRSVSGDGEENTIVPDIDNNVSPTGKSFPVFLQIYTGAHYDSVLVNTEVIGEHDRIEYHGSRTVASAHPSMNFIEQVPSDSLNAGYHLIRISVIPDPDSLAPVATSTQTRFLIHFPDLPETITDLDRAAHQLIYIASSSTIDSIKSAPDLLEKKRRFINFWQGYRSSFSSESRILMEEYYCRIAYADEHFAHFFEGWKSDMGMVYVLFGPPDNVQRHPFNIDSKPFEVWQYYRKAHQFIFVDETGFNDYRLRSPYWNDSSPTSGMDFIRN